MLEKNKKLFGELPPELKTPKGEEYIKDKNRNTVWLNSKTRQGDYPFNNFYTYSDFDFSSIINRLNEISKREEYLKSKGYNLEGMKSFNKSVLLDTSRQSNLMEGVVDDFDINLFDFRTKIRGAFAIDPKNKNDKFDMLDYFHEMMEKSRELEENNDSVIIYGNRNKHEINIETARQFMALKYVYKCAKNNRSKVQSASDMTEIILNSASIQSGQEIMRFRDRQARVTAFEEENEPNWKPETPNRIQTALKTLMNSFASGGNCVNLPTIVAAAIFHAEFIRIQPFFDGNKRTSRLFTNFMLIKDEFPTITFSYLNKTKYFRALQNAIVDHDLDSLIEFIVNELNTSLDNIEECLDQIELNPKCAPKVSVSVTV